VTREAWSHVPAAARGAIDRKLTPAEIADAFCELDDEGQAQVFIARDHPERRGRATRAQRQVARDGIALMRAEVW
jgi:hypothetical protein